MLVKYYEAYDKIEPIRIPRGRWIYITALLPMLERGRIVKKGFRLLDVGCGDGAYLKEMRSKGLEVYGVEPDSTKVAMAERVGVPVLLGTVTDMKDQSKFDVITFNHSFEHVPNPHEALEKCQSLLAQNGTLIIQVPRVDSWLTKIFKKNCQLFAIPCHLFDYSLRSMTLLLRNHGFQLIRVRQIIVPSAFIESMSLRVHRKEGEIRGKRALILVTLGLVFELCAYLVGKTGAFEVWAIAAKGSSTEAA